MTNKVQKIREEVEKLYNQSLADENRQTERGLERAANVSYGKSKACNELISFIDSLPEESVSEDFEEAAIKYLKENWDVDNVYEEDDLGIRNAFKAGAQWQKLKTKKEVIDNAVEWIVIENKNGGCVYDGWEEDFRKALEKGE